MNGPESALLRWAKFAALFIENNPYEPADMLQALKDHMVAEGVAYVNGVSEELVICEAVKREL